MSPPSPSPIAGGCQQDQSPPPMCHGGDMGGTAVLPLWGISSHPQRNACQRLTVGVGAESCASPPWALWGWRHQLRFFFGGGGGLHGDPSEWAQSFVMGWGGAQLSSQCREPTLEREGGGAVMCGVAEIGVHWQRPPLFGVFIHSMEQQRDLGVSSCGFGCWTARGGLPKMVLFLGGRVLPQCCSV